MIEQPREQSRNVIPRWRSFAAPSSVLESLSLSQDAALSGSTSLGEDQLESHLEAWRSHPGPRIASDLLSAAFVARLPNAALDAAQYVLEHSSEVSACAVHLAEALIKPDACGIPTQSTAIVVRQATLRQRIRELKGSLENYPRDPLRWLDLARAYTIAGVPSKARRCVQVSSDLARAHRVVLRSASRFYHHCDDFDRAHAVLTRSPALQADPWLMAAEIAIALSAGTTPVSIRRARRLLRSDRLPPFQRSELLASLGTADLLAGSYKTARRQYRDALIAPTENAVAQIAWASRNHLGETLEESTVERSSEARAWSMYFGGQWESALASAKDWLSDQPFSSRPAVFTTHLGVMLPNRLDETIEIAQLAVKANPSSFMVRNNLACALALRGDVNAAKVILSDIQHERFSPEENITWEATTGLTAIAAGDVDAGDAHYQTSIAIAEQASLSNAADLAHVFWALIRTKTRSGELPRLEAQISSIRESTDWPGVRLALHALDRCRTEALEDV